MERKESAGNIWREAGEVVIYYLLLMSEASQRSKYSSLTTSSSSSRALTLYEEVRVNELAPDLSDDGILVRLWLQVSKYSERLSGSISLERESLMMCLDPEAWQYASHEKTALDVLSELIILSTSASEISPPWERGSSISRDEDRGCRGGRVALI